MKRLFLGAAALGALVFSVTSSALTLDYYTGVGGDSAYNDTGAQYVQLTDITPPASAPMIELTSSILSTYNHDYIVGIFDANTRTELNVLDTYLGTTSSNVIFDLIGGTATSGLGTSAVGTTFGFFIRFYDDIGGGVLTGEDYFSDTLSDVFSIFYDPFGIASTGYSELALGIGGPGTQGHALVSVHDVAPVPLPAAVWLFGSALAGLLGFGRRRVGTATVAV